jgi:hypothetical protein
VGPLDDRISGYPMSDEAGSLEHRLGDPGVAMSFSRLLDPGLILRPTLQPLTHAIR